MPLALPFAVTHKKSITTSLTDSVTTTFDGLGRPYKTVHNSAGNSTVLTTYDGLSRVATVTNPFFSTADPTYGITQTQYGALGRVTQVAPPDGTALNGGTECLTNNVCTDYSNFPTVTSTDQAGKIHRSRADGLGRLVEVDEPGPGANSAGTGGSGSISISGSLHSSTTSGTRATGSFAITGGEQSKTLTQNCYADPNTGNWTCDPPQTIYDSGQVTVTINGFSSNYTYSQGDTTSSVAAGLAYGFSLSGSPVTASASGATVYLTANQPGPNYSMSQYSVTSDPSDFSYPSFGVNLSGPNMGGGAYPVTTYDSGTLTVTVNGFQASASYNQNTNSTASAMTQALTNALNLSGSPVTASVLGTTITLTARGVGTSTNYIVTGSSTASFTASSTTLSGGADPSGIFAPYLTLYSYDVLGNLIQVNQKGDGRQVARLRTFAYDSLSRVINSNNPETGQISYAYDANSHMVQKTSPAPNQTGTATQTLSYCYDQLNRVTGKAYSVQTCQNGRLPAGTAVVSYTYDTGTNAVGHLVAITDQAGSDSYTYDVLGRMASEQRTIAGVTKTVTYSYNVDGSVKSLTYPSGRVLTYTPDSAGRMISAIDANGTNYVTSAAYNAASAVTGFVTGNTSSFSGITNSLQYNPRLQLCRITALTSGTLPTSCADGQHVGNIMDVGYNYNLGTSDNGNISSTTNYRDSTRSQSFTYDGLNRVVSAWSQANSGTFSWGENYQIDSWGNLQISHMAGKANGGNLQHTADANNRLAGMSYGAAGNLMAYGSVSYTYDPENRLQGISGGISYSYDAGGTRVLKSQNGSPATTYWLASGNVLAEGDGAGNLTAEYVYFGGKRVARIDLPGNTVHYYLSDHLRSTSMVISASGGIEQDSDFSPFGAEYTATSGSNHYKFTGKERDAESGMDYFGARYYASVLGRFITPDWSPGPATVPYAHLGDPQTLNLYGYVDNNPVNGIDPDGHARQEYIVGARLGARLRCQAVMAI